MFDTNVLTSVDKRSDDARDSLYKVIRSLGDRLWIPYQVIFGAPARSSGIGCRQQMNPLWVNPIHC